MSSPDSLLLYVVQVFGLVDNPHDLLLLFQREVLSPLERGQAVGVH